MSKDPGRTCSRQQPWRMARRGITHVRSVGENKLFPSTYELTILVKSTTFLTSHPEISPLKLAAPKKANDMLVTDDVFQDETSELNLIACMN
jgi:hypothetical protein